MEFLLECPVCKSGVVLVTTDGDEYGQIAYVENCTNECDISPKLRSELAGEAMAAEREALY